MMLTNPDDDYLARLLHDALANEQVPLEARRVVGGLAARLSAIEGRLEALERQEQTTPHPAAPLRPSRPPGITHHLHKIF